MVIIFKKIEFVFFGIKFLWFVKLVRLGEDVFGINLKMIVKLIFIKVMIVIILIIVN